MTRDYCTRHLHHPYLVEYCHHGTTTGHVSTCDLNVSSLSMAITAQGRALKKHFDPDDSFHGWNSKLAGALHLNFFFAIDLHSLSCCRSPRNYVSISRKIWTISFAPSASLPKPLDWSWRTAPLAGGWRFWAMPPRYTSLSLGRVPG